MNVQLGIHATHLAEEEHPSLPVAEVELPIAAAALPILAVAFPVVLLVAQLAVRLPAAVAVLRPVSVQLVLMAWSFHLNAFNSILAPSNL